VLDTSEISRLILSYNIFLIYFRALGLGAQRGRLYIKHPDLFKVCVLQCVLIFNYFIYLLSRIKTNTIFVISRCLNLYIYITMLTAIANSSFHHSYNSSYLDDRSLYLFSMPVTRRIRTGCMRIITCRQLVEKLIYSLSMMSLIWLKQRSIGNTGRLNRLFDYAFILVSSLNM